MDITKLNPFRKKEVSMTREQGVAFLKEYGFWEPLPGQKASTWPNKGVLAFAIDLGMLKTPARAVHCINQERDVAYYENPDKAADAGNLIPQLKGRTFVIVRR